MSNLKSLEYYTELAETLVNNPDNVEKRKVWQAVDKMAKCEITLDPHVLSMTGGDERFADPVVADSIQAIKRFYAPRLPTLNILPMRPDDQERQDLDNMEQILEWEWTLLNRRSNESIYSRIVDSAARYGALAFQTKFLGYEKNRTVNGKKGGDKLYDDKKLAQLFRRGQFSWTLHNVQNVYPTWADDVLDEVLVTSVRPLRDVIAEFGEDNAAVKKLLSEYDADSPDELQTEMVSFFDYTNSYCRVIFARRNGSDSSLLLDGEEYVFQRAEHGLPFLPWVVVDFGASLFETIYRAGTYNHLAQVNAIAQSKLLAYGSETSEWIQTPDPNNPNVVRDTDDPSQPMVTDSQTTVNRLQQFPPDPSLMTLLQMLTNIATRSSAVMPLLEIGQIGGNTPYQSINAKQSTAIANLGLLEQVIKRGVEQGLEQCLAWVDYSQEPLVGYRRRGNDQFPTGTSLMMQSASMVPMQDGQVQPFPSSAIYFDSSKVYVEAKLMPVMISDKQAEAALAQLKEAIGFPKRKAIEDMGEPNPDGLLQESYGEALTAALVQLEIQKNQMALQLEQMKAQLQMQQQMQPPNPPGAPPGQAPTGNPQPSSPQTQIQQANGAQFAPTQGMEGRFGGPTPAQVVPNSNRPQVNGQSQAAQ